MGVVAVGFDYAGTPPTPAQIIAAGGQFIARYLCSRPAEVPAWKTLLTKAEADAALAAGLGVVCVFQCTKEQALRGAQGGHADGQGAWGQALGVFDQPDRAPCYFAVDVGFTSAQRPVVTAYLDAAATAYGRGRAGAYGGYDTIQIARSELGLPYGWQTTAWSAGRWHPDAQLRQVGPGPTIAGTATDRDEAWQPDYGQYQGAEDMPAYRDWAPEDRTALMDDIARIIGEGKKPDGTVPAHLAARSTQAIKDVVTRTEKALAAGTGAHAHTPPAEPELPAGPAKRRWGR